MTEPDWPKAPWRKTKEGFPVRALRDGSSGSLRRVRAAVAVLLGAAALMALLHLTEHAGAGSAPGASVREWLHLFLAWVAGSCTLGGLAFVMLASRRTHVERRRTSGEGDPEPERGDERTPLYDRLTKLPSRELLRDRIERAIQRRQRDRGARFALLIIDLDGFNVVNRSLGHEIGDQLLVAAAQRLRNNLRATDTAARAASFAARLGGDEFVVLLEGAGEPTDIERVVERLQHALSQAYEIEGHEIVLTSSIGIVTHDGNYERPEAALRDADIAVSRAKSAGKARHVFFDASRHAASVERLGLATALRRAVRDGEFEAHYQPIIRLDDGSVTGVEALLRWNCRERGRVSPADFVPLAEELGLIVPIGEWVLGAAARQLHAWRDSIARATKLRMAVNVSPRQLADPGLVPYVQQVLERERLEPHALCLEITESAVMEDPAAAEILLHRLRELGVGLSMDDFGTGHSSLSSLQRFPFTTLKIDRSFVQKLGDGEPSGLLQAAILQTVITLAHTIGLEVVAEGVEKEAQAEALRALSCDRAQGYLFAAPMPASELEDFLARRAAELAGVQHP
jgi:diguanylate cyclase (GGDEF)-like protein